MGNLLMRREESMKTRFNKIFSVLAVFFFCLTTFTASAYDLKADLTIYFDVTNFGDFSGKDLQIMIGHGSYSTTYAMTKVAGFDKIYKVNIGDINNGGAWGGATQLGFMAATGIWGPVKDGDSNKSPQSRLPYADLKTKVYNIKKNLSGNVLFKITKTSDKSIGMTEDAVSYYITGIVGNNKIKMTYDANSKEYVLKKQTVKSTDVIKVRQEIDSYNTEYKTLEDGSCATSASNGISMQDGIYDFYFKLSNNKLFVGANESNPTKYLIMGVDGDWDNGIEIKDKNPNNADEVMLTCLNVTSDAQIKIAEKKLCQVEWKNAVKDGSVVSKPSGDNNISLPKGFYSFYYNTKDHNLFIGNATQTSCYLVGTEGGDKVMTLKDNQYELKDIQVKSSDVVKIKLVYACGNVEYKNLDAASCSTVKYTASGIRFQKDGYYDFYFKLDNNQLYVGANSANPANADKYYLVGIGGDWDNGDLLEANTASAGEYMLLNKSIDADDEFKIVKTSLCADRVYYDNIKESPCSEKVTGGNGKNIKLPTGTYDFYFKESEGIYITPSPSSIKYYLMGVDTDGNGETSDNWEADSNYELTPSQEPGKENELVLLGATIPAANSMKIVKKTPCGDDYYADVKLSSPVPYSGGGSQNIVLEAGTYDFYFNKESGEIYIGGTLDNAKVVHLDPKAEDGSDWEADDARMAVHYRKSDTDNGWVTAEKCNTYYFAQIPEGYTEYFWVRMNPNRTENRWNSDDDGDAKPVWNQSSGIKYDAQKTLTIMKDMEWDCYQTVYSGICGENFNNLNCTFPEAKDTVFVTINQFVDSDPCNYIFRSFEQAFAVLKNNKDICTSSTITLGGLKEDVIDFTKHVVMLVHFGPAYYRGTEKVGMSGGHVGNAPAIFFRNINENSDKQLVVRTADPKGNRAVLVHPVIRRSKNIVLDNLDIISDKNLRDNALDVDTGKGDETLEYTDGNDKNFNIVPLPTVPSNITLKNCYVESYGRNGIHIVGISGLHVENNEFYTKYDFTGSQSDDEKHDVVDWGGTIKFINCTDVKFLRNNSEGTLATSFFIQGCQRMLIMNNVFWNDNKVEVPGLSGTGRTVANVRLVNYVDEPNIAKAGDFPVKNIGVYYNTFFIRSNDSESAKDSYVTFDFFRLGGLKQPVRDNNAGNKYFDPTTIRFKYNNCYSYDKDIVGNNRYDTEKQATDPVNAIKYYLQGIGEIIYKQNKTEAEAKTMADWCACFSYNNFWSEYDKVKELQSSNFEIGMFCTGDNETFNLYEDVSTEVCETSPTNPGSLVVLGGDMNIGTVVVDDVSLQGADKLYNDRLNPDNGTYSARPQVVVDNSNESLNPYDDIYLEPGVINLYTSPLVGSQTTDVYISSLDLSKQQTINLTLVDKNGNALTSQNVDEKLRKSFGLTDANGNAITSLETESGNLNNVPVYVTFARPADEVEDDITYEIFLEVVPAIDNYFILRIPIRGHHKAKIESIPGAWTVGAFQQRNAMPVDTIVWHGSASTDWDNRNNWYKTDGTLVTCLDALTEDLTVIIPNKESENYVTPPAGITNYPILPDGISTIDGFTTDRHKERVNAGSNDKATKVANKIYMEYGAALVGVEELAKGTSRYTEVEQEFVARRHDWLLVGGVVNPFKVDEEGNRVTDGNGNLATRPMVSGDYYLGHLPHVYMHSANINGNSVGWDESFAPLNVEVDPKRVFAVRLPNQYGPKKWPAEVYNRKNNPEIPYDGNAPHTYKFTGRFYNEENVLVYKDLVPQTPALLTNTYPANINAFNLQDAKGTIQIYDYENKEFRAVGQDETDAEILSQHGFLFTPATVKVLEVDKGYYKSTATGHRSAAEEVYSFRIKTTNYKESVSSEVYISFDELKEDVANYLTDAPKVFNGKQTALAELYVMRYDKKWAGISIPEMTKPIPLGVKVASNDQKFIFSLAKSNLPYEIFLEDRQEGKTYNLSAGERCVVEDLVAGNCEGRFYLMLSENEEEELPEDGDEITTDAEETESLANGIDIFTQENSIVVSCNSEMELMQVVVSDVAGRHQVYNVSGQYVKLDLPVSTGVYTISVIGDKATRVEKIKLD